jgi:hypothetical protein
MSRFDDISEEMMAQYDQATEEATARAFRHARFIVVGTTDKKNNTTYFGAWKVGKDPSIDITDVECIACPDECSMGWARFENNKPVEELWVRQLGNTKPPCPESDKSKWDTWADGRPKNPWSFREQIPLKIITGELAGQTVLYTSTTEADRLAIKDMQKYFAQHRRRPLTKPSCLKKGEGKEGIVPTFKVIEATEDDAPIPGIATTRTAKARAKTATNGDNADTDDGRFDTNAGWWDRDQQWATRCGRPHAGRTSFLESDHHAGTSRRRPALCRPRPACLSPASA